MEVIVLIEFEAGTAATNAVLLQRLASMALKGHARLGFVGTSTDGGPARDVVALGLPSQGAAESLLAQWHVEGIIAEATPVRILRLHPLCSMDPLILLFP